MNERTPGKATQVFIYRYLRRTRLGQPRELVDNFTPQSDLERVVRDCGPGRYRLEWRDDKRWVTKVRVWVVLRNGEIVDGRPLRRRRKVGSPVHVPPPRRLESRPRRGGR